MALSARAQQRIGPAVVVRLLVDRTAHDAGNVTLSIDQDRLQGDTLDLALHVQKMIDGAAAENARRRGKSPKCALDAGHADTRQVRLAADIAEHRAAITVVEGPGLAGLALDRHGLFAARQRPIAAFPQVLSALHLFGDEVNVVGMPEGIRPTDVLGAARRKPRAARDGDAAQVRVVREGELGRIQQRWELTDLHVKFAAQERSAGARALRGNGERVRTRLSRATTAAQLEERQRLRDAQLLQRLEIDALSVRAQQAIEQAPRRPAGRQLGDDQLRRHGHAGQPEIGHEAIDLEHPLGAERHARHAQEPE